MGVVTECQRVRTSCSSIIRMWNDDTNTMLRLHILNTDNNASKYLAELDIWFYGITHKHRWTIVTKEIRRNNGNIWQDLDGFWCFYPFVDIVIHWNLEFI